MSRSYDPIDYETWPDEQKDMAGAAWRGLHDGDLGPLADYLRAGFHIEPALANDIADAIEGTNNARVRLRATRKRGERTLTAAIEDHEYRMKVGLFIERRVREIGPGGYDSAIAEARTVFGFKAKTSRPADYHSYVKALLDAHSRGGTWDAFAVYESIYSS